MEKDYEVEREITCCRTKDGHVTNCPKIQVLKGGGVRIVDDFGGSAVLANADQASDVMDALGEFLFEVPENATE